MEAWSDEVGRGKLDRDKAGEEGINTKHRDSPEASGPVLPAGQVTRTHCEMEEAQTVGGRLRGGAEAARGRVRR